MFITKDIMDKILAGDVETFNKVIEEVSIKTVETTLRSIPVMIGKLVQVTATTGDLVKNLYDENPDFKDYKELTVMVIQEVDSANPGLSYPEVAAKAVPIIKERIAEYKRLSGNQSTTMPDLSKLNKLAEGVNGAL